MPAAVGETNCPATREPTSCGNPIFQPPVKTRRKELKPSNHYQRSVTREQPAFVRAVEFWGKPPLENGGPKAPLAPTKVNVLHAGRRPMLKKKKKKKTDHVPPGAGGGVAFGLCAGAIRVAQARPAGGPAVICVSTVDEPSGTCVLRAIRGAALNALDGAMAANLYLAIVPP